MFLFFHNKPLARNLYIQLKCQGPCKASKGLNKSLTCISRSLRVSKRPFRGEGGLQAWVNSDRKRPTSTYHRGAPRGRSGVLAFPLAPRPASKEAKGHIDHGKGQPGGHDEVINGLTKPARSLYGPEGLDESPGPLQGARSLMRGGPPQLYFLLF